MIVQALIADKESAIENLKKETRDDLLEMHKKFTDKENSLMETIKKKDVNIGRLKDQLGGTSLHRHHRSARH